LHEVSTNHPGNALQFFPNESIILSNNPLTVPYLSSEVCKVIVTNVMPAEFFNGNNVNIVRKCCGFNFFVNAPDDDDSPAAMGTTGVAI